MIGGPEGAAAKLGLKRTTLFYKMKKFGISRPKPNGGIKVSQDLSPRTHLLTP
jgi:hypothetical protein